MTHGHTGAAPRLPDEEDTARCPHEQELGKSSNLSQDKNCSG